MDIDGDLDSRAVHTITTNRMLGSLNVSAVNEIRNELDSHADTLCCGEKTMLMIQDFSRPVQVYVMMRQ